MMLPTCLRVVLLKGTFVESLDLLRPSGLKATEFSTLMNNWVGLKFLPTMSMDVAVIVRLCELRFTR